MPPDLTVLSTEYGDGGVERMLVNTMNGLGSLGVRVDFLVSRGDGPYMDELLPSVRVQELAGRSEPAGRALEHYLRQQRPPRLVTAKLRDDALAVEARRRAGADTRLYFRVGNPLVHRLRQRTRTPVGRWWGVRRLARLYRNADACIAVSRGIAEDLAEGLGVSRQRILTLPNPTITEALYQRAREPVAHPWLAADAGVPVVMAAGGLRQQKDFPTLVRAFARLRQRHPCRLVILGQGRQRERLLALARELDAAEQVDLPGWVANPHAWMARASAFVLSSRWEGSPNVLVEAAALGTPLVATDCISGPRDILQDGRYGELVPVGDSRALAGALARVLDHPPDPVRTRRAAEPYTLERSARAYMRALGMEGRATETAAP